ncbi:MAG: alpha/beta hydrolase-fold protein [Pirellulaceae bacterium]
MGRLQLGVFGPKSSTSPTSSSEIGAFQGGGDSSRHIFFVPMHYEPNYAYPLVVWLHGTGDDERQLMRVMPLVSMRNYLAVSPRGTAKAEVGYDWRQSEPQIESAQQRVFAAVEDARKRFHVERRRVFIAGYGAGGTMALRVALRNPDSFAGALTIGGPFPDSHLPLSQLDQVRRLPLFFAQGREAESYPMEQTCRELRLFHAAGMNATLRLYPCGDELTSNMLHDMDVWMMEHVTGVESPVE